jgi:L-ascorbate metabolism protein UlaG (beta-lactamase superfamily)
VSLGSSTARHESPLSSLELGERALFGKTSDETDAAGGLRTDLRDPVRVRWLGTAGFALTFAGTTVLLDPYLTRASLLACLRGPLQPDETLLAEHLPVADAIVLGHTHFDHALDTPSIAKRTGATVFGSRSAATLCRLAQVPATQVVDVESRLSHEHAGYEAEVGPFRLRFLPSAHSELLLGRVPFPGEIDDCDAIPMRTEAYACGAVFSVEIRVAGKTIYHLGSANLVERNIRTPQVDLLLLCVAGWTKTSRFCERVMRSLSPGTVLLSHWDDFTQPLANGPRLLPAMAVPKLVDGLGAFHRDTRVGTVPLLGELWL